MKEQTAVEWLVEQLTEVERKNWINNKILAISKNSLAKQTFDGIIQQANKMFEQQIIDAGADHCYPTCELARVDAEKYYNSTYGSKGSDDHIVDTNEMVSSQTEISDEEIEDRAAEWMEEDWDVKTYYEAFIDGASWYREQLKQKQ